MTAREWIEERLVPPLMHGDVAHQEWLRGELRKWIPELETWRNAGLEEAAKLLDEAEADWDTPHTIAKRIRALKRSEQ